MPGNKEDCPIQYMAQRTLVDSLINNDGHIIVLDCRNSDDYYQSHIRDASNPRIPKLMLRRLATAKGDSVSIIKQICKIREASTDSRKQNVFLLYDERDSNSSQQSNEMLDILLRRLHCDGHIVYRLEGSYIDFKNTYPEWCETSDSSTGKDNVVINKEPSSQESSNLTLSLGLRILNLAVSSNSSNNLKTSGSTSNSSTENDNSKTISTVCRKVSKAIGSVENKDFPVEIIPNLYLGNKEKSADLEALNKHNIKYILNVTSDLPNVFIQNEDMHYMKIPIFDNSIEDLLKYFPAAIEFINEGRSKKVGVLVHCLAGISRSVTVTVAYLMQHRKLNMEEAFSIVESRKSDVEPNFNFLQQLRDFEEALNKDNVSVPSHLLSFQSANTDNKLEVMTDERCVVGTTSMHISKETSKIKSPCLMMQRDNSSSMESTDSYNIGSIESGISSSCSSADQKCEHCGTPYPSRCCSRCLTSSTVSHFLKDTTSVFGNSPDSGIEFDRWTSNSTGE